jgi:hypothetical protein
MRPPQVTRPPRSRWPRVRIPYPGPQDGNRIGRRKFRNRNEYQPRRGSTAPWSAHRPGLARGRLPARAGGSAGGAKRSPPALVDRSSDDTARPQPPLHPVGPSLPLGETFLGLQQPVHHQQLAHQVVQGLAGGSPVRIADRPGQERVGLLCSSGVIRRGSAILAPSIDSSGAAAGSSTMTSMISTKPKAARSRRRAASWSSSTSGTRPCPEGDALDRQMQSSAAQAVGCTWSSAASWRISAAG